MRVALCLSGMVRTLKQTQSSILEHLVEPFSPDIFVHTYDMMGLRKEDDIPVSEALLTSTLRPTAVRIRPLSEWGPYYRRERDRLYAIPGPIWCCGIPGESRWRLANVLAGAWHVRECDLLRRQHEAEQGFTYDVVIRARMDNLFCQTPNLPGFELSHLPEETVFIPNHSGFGGLCDQFALGAGASMAVYSDYFIHFEEVYRSRTLLPLYYGAPEMHLKRYFDKFTKLQCVPFTMPFEIQRETEVERQSHKTEEFFRNVILRGLAA